MNTEMIPMLLCLVAILPLTGAFLAATPWLMKGRECFAVTVPETAQSDPRLRGYKLRYSALVGAVTLVLTLAGAAFVFAQNTTGIVVLMVVGTLMLCAGSFAVMLHYRRKVMGIKRAEGWQAVVQEHVSAAGEYNVPKLPSLAWSLLYVPVVGITVLACALAYPAMPDMIPMHVDFSGNVTDAAPKTPLSAAFPLVVQVFLAAALVFSHWSILRSKKGANPEAPAASLWAYAMFARAQIILLIAGGLALCLGMMLFVPAATGAISLAQAGAAIVFLAIVFVVAAMAVSLVYGQSGARILARMSPADELRYDDDEHWKLGIFYFNKEDASLFLPERFGIGWTVNLARPAVWAIMGGFAAVTVGFVIAVACLVG